MERREFLSSILTIPLLTQAMDIKSFYNEASENKLTERMPVLFVGHGNPMNALYDNAFTKTLNAWGNRLDKPTAILVISAHWLTQGVTQVSSNPKPQTIHDFGGFPQELFNVQYTPVGHPTLAHELAQNVTSIKVHEDHQMGLDHGAWTILKHMYPKADIPVFQMSIDFSKPASYHLALAAELKKLRDRGVLIMGSGNIVHNLGAIKWDEKDSKPYDWAVEFDSTVKKLIDAKEFDKLANFQSLGKSASLSHPSIDHYLPMIYSLGITDKSEDIAYTYEGFEMGSISMRCFETVMK